MIRRRLAAFNTATASENKIHDDATAKRFGFSGGLVPGVDVHAYLCWGPAEVWGLDWVERGTITSRYTRPTYDGATVTVEFDADTGGCRLLDGDEAVLAEGRATMPLTPDATPDAMRDAMPDAVSDPERFPWAPLPEVRPRASCRTLSRGTVLGSVDTTFPDEESHGYLDDVRERVELYRTHGIAHPGWVLRLANRVLKQNVELGPWIHTSSAVRHHGAIREGASVSCRGTVADEYERSGHRFAELALAVWADDVPVATIHHTAIHLPRQVRDADREQPTAD